MIFYLEAELEYKSPPNAFILLDNLSSVLEDLTIIEKKVQKDLALGRMVDVPELYSPFINLLLGLVQHMTENSKILTNFFNHVTSPSMTTSLIESGRWGICIFEESYN